MGKKQHLEFKMPIHQWSRGKVFKRLILNNECKLMSLFFIIISSKILRNKACLNMKVHCIKSIQNLIIYQISWWNKSRCYAHGWFCIDFGRKIQPWRYCENKVISHSYLIQSKVMSHICSKQDSISSKIKECCEKKIPERGECIIYSNKDDRPNNLPLREAKFTESENVCEERDADQENFMAE